MHICIFGGHIEYNLLTKDITVDNSLRSMGGAELQQCLVGRSLSKLNHKVTFIVPDFGQEEKMVINNINIVNSFIRDGEGLKVLGIFYPRAFKLLKTMKKVNADVYISRCAGPPVFFGSLFSKLLSKKYVYSMSHDDDVHFKTCHPENIRDKILYFIGIWICKNVITQNEYQYTNIRKRIRNAEIIPSISHYELPNEENRKDIDILWISRIVPFKQPYLLGGIAEKFKDYKITIIGNYSESHKNLYYDTINEISKFPNISYLDFVPYNKIFKYFQRSKVFINTSKKEGFPNTFLQAWSAKTPVVSLNVDPNDIIKEHNLGFCGESENIESFLRNIEKLLQKDKLRYITGNNGYNYVKSNHTADSVGQKYITAFRYLK